MNNSPYIFYGDDAAPNSIIRLFEIDTLRELNSPTGIRVSSFTNSPFDINNSPEVFDSPGNSYKPTELVQEFQGTGWPPPPDVDVKTLNRFIADPTPVRHLYYWVLWQVEKTDLSVDPVDISTELEVVEYKLPVGNQTWKDLSVSLPAFIPDNSPLII